MISSVYNNRKLAGGKQINAIRIAVFLLVFFKMWAYLFKTTVLATVAMEYISYISVFIAFIYAILSQNNICRFTKLSTCWLPYVLLTLFGYMFINRDIGRFVWWLAPFMMLLLAPQYGFLNAVPKKLLFWSGIVAMIGVYVQFLLPSFYMSYIAPYIRTGELFSLEEVTGMRGFSHQQGTTSIILIYGVIALLYFKDEVLPLKLQKGVLYWVLVSLVILAIFLTGKRTMSIIAIIVPVFVFLLSSKGIKRMQRIILIAFGGTISFFLILPSLFETSDLFIIRRLADSADIMKSGGDISSGRDYLWDLAKAAYHQHPVFGIGVGNFISYTRAETDTHNTYLQTLCEQGLVGFVCYVFALFCSLLYTLKVLSKTIEPNLNRYMQAALAIELVYLIYAITGNVNIDVDVIMYFLAIAITINIDIIHKIRRT